MTSHELIFGIVLVGGGFIYVVLTTLYIFAAGSIGIFAVKRKLPMIFPSGAIIIKGYDSSYVDIDFGVYKSKYTWGSILGKRDKRVTHVGKPQNRERGTGIPMLFLKEGEITNFDPFNSREPEKGSELFSEIAIAEYAAGYNEARQKFQGGDNLQVITAVLSFLAFVGAFVGVVLLVTQLDISNQILTKLDSFTPIIENAVKTVVDGLQRIE